MLLTKGSAMTAETEAYWVYESLRVGEHRAVIHRRKHAHEERAHDRRGDDHIVDARWHGPYASWRDPWRRAESLTDTTERWACPDCR